MLFRFTALEHQFHRECVAITAEGLNRPIILVPAGDGPEAAWLVRQRAAAGRVLARRAAPGPLDALDMREIAARALRERGLDPLRATWREIRICVANAPSVQAPASGS